MSSNRELIWLCTGSDAFLELWCLNIEVDEFALLVHLYTGTGICLFDGKLGFLYGGLLGGVLGDSRGLSTGLQSALLLGHGGIGSGWGGLGLGLGWRVGWRNTLNTCLPSIVLFKWRRCFPWKYLSVMQISNRVC